MLAGKNTPVIKIARRQYELKSELIRSSPFFPKETEDSGDFNENEKDK